jgi:hypothetical protein
MTAQAQVAWYSTVQYRHNPADAVKGVIDLGFAVEFTTQKAWVVGLALRAALDEAQIADLDDLTRKLLEQRSAIVSREIEQVLQKAMRPGEALALLAANNPWSLHVTAPKKLALPAAERRALSKATVTKHLEDYALRIQGEEDDVAAPWVELGKPVVRRLPPPTTRRSSGSRAVHA